MRWKQLEYVLDEVDKTIAGIWHNHYACLHTHWGENVYVTVVNFDGYIDRVDIRQCGLSPLDNKQHLATQDVSLITINYRFILDNIREVRIAYIQPRISVNLPRWLVMEHLGGGIYVTTNDKYPVLDIRH